MQDLKPLNEETINKNPFKQFEEWFQFTSASGIPEPDAMVLSSVSQEKFPSQRTVLMKSYDERGFVFYTNYGSRKAKEIGECSNVSLLFPWHMLRRQVIIQGRAKKISAAESLKYFLTRPRGSQIGAWSSNQSQVISSRSVIENEFFKMKEKFSSGEIPLPPFWGGYRVEPVGIEFWQAGEHRLHDRFLFRKNSLKEWASERLSP